MLAWTNYGIENNDDDDDDDDDILAVLLLFDLPNVPSWVLDNIHVCNVKALYGPAVLVLS